MRITTSLLSTAAVLAATLSTAPVMAQSLTGGELKHAVVLDFPPSTCTFVASTDGALDMDDSSGSPVWNSTADATVSVEAYGVTNVTATAGTFLKNDDGSDASAYQVQGGGLSLTTWGSTALDVGGGANLVATGDPFVITAELVDPRLTTQVDLTLGYSGLTYNAPVPFGFSGYQPTLVTCTLIAS